MVLAISLMGMVAIVALIVWLAMRRNRIEAEIDAFYRERFTPAANPPRAAANWRCFTARLGGKAVAIHWWVQHVRRTALPCRVCVAFGAGAATVGSEPGGPQYSREEDGLRILEWSIGYGSRPSYETILAWLERNVRSV